VEQEAKIAKMSNVFPISFAVFFNDMGSDMLFAFYPIFFIQVLKISEMKILGLVDSLACAFRILGIPKEQFGSLFPFIG